MKSFGMKLASTVFLFVVATVHGWTPGPETPCPEPTDPGGFGFVPDNKYCRIGHRCEGNTRYNFTCPLGTLWDSEINNCRHCYDTEIKCQNWPCVDGKPKARYPDFCKKIYYECGAGLKGFTMHECPPGQHYDMELEMCVDGVGVDDPSCDRSVKNETAPCNLAPDSMGNPCMYQAKDGNRSTPMECPVKSAFNQSTCGCTTVDESCTKENLKNNNKMPDNLCRETFYVGNDKFVNGTLRAYSYKISQILNDSIQTTGVTFANSIATFSSSDTSKAMMYVWSFNYNELTNYPVFTITFRSAGPTTYEIPLFINNYNNACMPTFYITFTLVGTTYNITVYAKVFIKGTSTVMEDKIFVTILVGQGSFVEVTAVAEINLKLRVVDKGPSGTSTGTSANAIGTVNFGSKSALSFNKCGLKVCYGLNGVVAKWGVHEGCRNTTIMMTR